MSVPLTATFYLEDKYSKALLKIINATQQADNATRQMTNTTEQLEKQFQDLERKGGKSVDKLSAKLVGLVSVGYTVKKAFDFAWKGIQGSALQGVQENTIQSLLGNDQLGSGMYDWLSEYAKKSMLGREDIAKGFMSFNTVAQDMSQIERMIKMTERLYAKDPTQGAEGAVFAMKEVLAGDVISMRNRFGITGISGETVRNLTAAGDTEGALDYIDKILNQFGATQAVVDKNVSGLTAQMNMFASNFQTAFAESMSGARDAMVPVFTELQANLEAGRYEPFFNMFAQGTLMVVQGLSWIAGNIEWLLPLLGTLITLLVAYKVQSMIASGVQMTFGASSMFAAMGLTGLNAAVAAAAWWIIPLIIALGAGAAMLGAFGNAASDAKEQMSRGMSPEELDANYKAFKTTTLDTNIVNDKPIAVKGDVAIEDESLEYLLDIAERDFVANYSQATLAPQLSVQIERVERSVDADEFIEVLGSKLEEMVSSEPEGAY
ncbi:MAG: hypothetical protein RR565_09675 [Erysipelothrix sp.]